MSENAKLPAYPAHHLLLDRDGDYSMQTEGGLTKRELFAAMAMQGMVSSSYYTDGEGDREIAGWAVEQADALLAALADR